MREIILSQTVKLGEACGLDFFGVNDGPPMRIKETTTSAPGPGFAYFNVVLFFCTAITGSATATDAFIFGLKSGGEHAWLPFEGHMTLPGGSPDDSPRDYVRLRAIGCYTGLVPPGFKAGDEYTFEMRVRGDDVGPASDAEHPQDSMRIDDPRNPKIVGDGFARWYHSEIERYVSRCKLTELSVNDAARLITRNVSQFAMGRLVTELGSVGMSVGQIIEFLKKHATS